MAEEIFVNILPSSYKKLCFALGSMTIAIGQLAPRLDWSSHSLLSNVKYAWVIYEINLVLLLQNINQLNGRSL